MKGVDLFCGGGGFTLALEREGVEVVAAVNHWDKAIEVHSRNHPNTRHDQANLVGFDYTTLEAHDILVAGNSCQPHSRAGQVGRANSEKVYDDHVQMRATAWAVHACLEVCRPRLFVSENVPEYLGWVDLAEWLHDIRALGYAVTQQVLCASRWGVAQRRHRVFFVGVLGGRPVAVQNPDVPEPGAITFFDSTAGGWVPISKMRKTVSKRGHPTACDRATIANRRLGGALGWGVHVSHAGAWGRPASEPITTLTTKAGQHWWVRDGQYRLWTEGERKAAMGFPASYDLCGATKSDAAKLLGNAVPPPMAAGVIRAAIAGC